MSLDPDLRARLEAGPSIDAWDALRRWLDAGARSQPPSAAALAEADVAMAAWPAGNRAATAQDWTRIAAGGRPPSWWPLVRAVTIDEFAGLEPVGALQDVVKLSFGQRAANVQVADLAALPALRELVMGGLGGDALMRMPPLPLPQLQRLSMTVDRLPQDFAQRFAQLQILSLSRSSMLERLPPLPAGLQALDLSGCPRLTDLGALQACASLQMLDLRGCDGIRSLDALRGLPLLARLRLDARHPRSLAPLAGVPSLQSLWIGAGPASLDLGPLAGHAGLREIGLDGCTPPVGLQALSHLPALQQLHVLRCGLEALPSLGHASKLRVLDVEGLPALQALPALPAEHRLDLLRLVGLPRLVLPVLPAAARQVVQACPGVAGRTA